MTVSQHASLCGLAVFSTLCCPLLFGREVEWLLDLDDKDNFVEHPLVTYLVTGKTQLPGIVSLSLTPVLGVVEPIAALIRGCFAVAFGRQAVSVYVFASALQAFNTAQLAILLDELHLPMESVSVGVLCWALHPLRGEVLGWLSCQSYLLALAFTLLCIRADLSDRPWLSVLCFIFACGSKVAVATVPFFLAILSVARKMSILHDAKTPMPFTAPLLRAASWSALRYLPHGVVAACAVIFTVRANAPAAVDVSRGVSAEAGLFWGPAALSPLGLAARAATAATVWYPLKTIHPFGLRVLYLVPRSFAGSLHEDKPDAGYAGFHRQPDDPVAEAGGQMPLELLLIGLGVVFIFVASWMQRAAARGWGFHNEALVALMVAAAWVGLLLPILGEPPS